MFGASFGFFILNPGRSAIRIRFRKKYFTFWRILVVALGFLHVVVGLIAGADWLLFKAVFNIRVCVLENHIIYKINSKKICTRMDSDNTRSHSKSIRRTIIVFAKTTRYL